MTTATEIDLESLLTESAHCEWEHIDSECCEVATHVVHCRCDGDAVLTCDSGASEARTWIADPMIDCDMCSRVLGDCWWMRVA